MANNEEISLLRSSSGGSVAHRPHYSAFEEGSSSSSSFIDNTQTLPKPYVEETEGAGGKKKDKKKKKKVKYDSSDSDDDYGDAIPLRSFGGTESIGGDTTNVEIDGEERRARETAIKLAKSKYDMKNHMANERTFFKYLFTGLHIGGIGTLVLTFFSQTDDALKLYLVLIIWLLAFAFMGWGLFSYYRRKSLMESGKFKDTQLLSPHTPLLITCLFAVVIFLVLMYALYAHHFPAKEWRSLLTVDAPPRVRLLS